MLQPIEQPIVKWKVEFYFFWFVYWYISNKKRQRLDETAFPQNQFQRISWYCEELFLSQIKRKVLKNHISQVIQLEI